MKIEQHRQWALSDSIGTSSAFFAEALQNLFKNWSLDIDGFFADIDEVAEELEDWLRKLLVELGVVGRIAGLLVDGIAAATRGGARAGRRERMEKVFDSVGMDRKVLAESFRELSLQALIPSYGYWPVDDPSPAGPFKNTRFADGGNLENTGIGGLLAYQDIDNLIAFINTSSSMTAGDLGTFDAQGNELPGTRVVIGSQIPPLFGYQPWQKDKGYRLYEGDAAPASPEMRHNRVLTPGSFAELLQGRAPMGEQRQRRPTGLQPPRRTLPPTAGRASQCLVRYQGPQVRGRPLGLQQPGARLVRRPDTGSPGHPGGLPRPRLLPWLSQLQHHRHPAQLHRGQSPGQPDCLGRRL